MTEYKEDGYKEDDYYPVIRKERKQPTMVQHKKGDVEYLTFRNLEKLSGFRHLFSTRLGGVSTGIYASMNLSFTRGDDAKAVFKNFEIIADVLDTQCDRFVLSDQTHTDHIRVVTKEDAGCGLTTEITYHDVDGLITNEKGLVLSTFYADCVPIFLIDPVKKAIGLCHSGWKGTVAEISLKTVRKMQEAYGSGPQDIYAAIAPSICQDCYEVSEDVILEFAKVFGSTDKDGHGYGEELLKELYYKKENGKYQLNLWAACYHTLLKAGLLKEHIEVTDICTCCNKDYLFSHRASHGKRGNLGAFLMICD